MTDRRLTPDERQIWHKVARTVSPRRRGSARPEPTHEEFAGMMRVPPHVPDHRPKAAIGAPALNQDRKIRRGRVTIDRKLDLHDKTQAEAYPLLRLSLQRAGGAGAEMRSCCNRQRRAAGRRVAPGFPRVDQCAGYSPHGGQLCSGPCSPRRKRCLVCLFETNLG